MRAGYGRRWTPDPARPTSSVTGRIGAVVHGAGAANGVDAVVAGAGPAGLALAAELTVRGVSVLLVDPRPDAAWKPTYCGWADELATAPGFDPARSPLVRHRAVLVEVDGACRTVERPYVQLDSGRATAALRRRAGSGPGVYRERAGRVGPIVDAPGPTGGGGRLLVRVRDDLIPARVVVDATGAGGTVGTDRKPASDATVWQWAVGTVARFAQPPVEPGGAVVMDWRQVRGDPDDPAVPGSFGYVLDRGDGTHLVEETVLAGPRVRGVMGVLRRRLGARIAAAGWQADQAVGEELVAIPLDVGPRRSRGGVLPIGVAAGVVHPASGYSVTAALRTAPAVADAVAGALGDGRNPAEVAAAGSAALWPRRAVAAHAALTRGMRTTLDQGPTETSAFFAAFFALPTPVWSGYLAQPAGPGGVATAMARLWLSLPPPDAARLVRRWVRARRV